MQRLGLAQRHADQRTVGGDGEFVGSTGECNGVETFTCTTTCGWIGAPFGGGGGFGFGGTIVASSDVIDDERNLYFLVIPGEARYLKQF